MGFWIVFVFGVQGFVFVLGVSSGLDSRFQSMGLPMLQVVGIVVTIITPTIIRIIITTSTITIMTM